MTLNQNFFFWASLIRPVPFMICEYIIMNSMNQLNDSDEIIENTMYYFHETDQLWVILDSDLLSRPSTAVGNNTHTLEITQRRPALWLRKLYLVMLRITSGIAMLVYKTAKEPETQIKQTNKLKISSCLHVQRGWLSLAT